MNTKLEELKAKVAEIQKEIEKLEKQDSKYLDLSANERWSLGEKWEKCDIEYTTIEIRRQGIYENKGFFLTDKFDWEIIKDDLGCLVLLPTKK